MKEEYKLYTGLNTWNVYSQLYEGIKGLNDITMKQKRWDYTQAQKMGIMKMASWFSHWCDINFYATGMSATGGDIARWLSVASGETSYNEYDKLVLTTVRELYLKNCKYTDVGDMNTTLS